MKKSTLVAIVVFVALLVGVGYVLTRKPERGISRMSFATVDKATIDRLEITGKNPVTLVKQDGVWRLEGGKAADNAAVDRLLESIPKLGSSDLVTKSEEKFADLEVTEEKGAHVKAKQGQKLVADFTVGKYAAGGAHVLVDGAVYVVTGISMGSFSRDKASWLERKLFDDKLADAKKLEITLVGQTSYALVAEGDTWKVEDAKLLPAGFRFDSAAARSLISSLVTLRAKDILDADPGVEKTGLTDKADTLVYTVEIANGDTKKTERRELRLGATLEDKSVYAQVLGKTDIVTLPEATAKNLRKAVTDFRDLKMMDFDKEKVAKIEVKDGKMRLVLEKVGAEWKIASSSEVVPKDFELDAMAVTRRLAALQGARAAKLATESMATAGLAAPTAEVIVTFDDKKTVSVAFGKGTKDEDREMFFARGNADKAVYLVTKWTRDNICGGLKSFKKTGDPSGLSNLDPKALQGLPPDVRAGLQKQIEDKRRQQEMLERLSKQAKP